MASFPLLGHKNQSAHLQHLSVCNHNNSVPPHPLSYIIHGQKKIVVITCEVAVVPLPAQVWKNEHDLPTFFKGDMFTRRVDS